MSHLANILCDIEIVVAMIYYVIFFVPTIRLSSLNSEQLSRHRTISSSRLHRQVKRLIKLVLETGMLTSQSIA